MKLFILLVCLAIERYLHIGTISRRFFWLERYLTRLQKRYANHLDKLEGYRGILVALAPIFIIVGIPNIIIYYMGTVGMSALLLHFIVLMYCLGPNNLFHHVEVYLRAKREEDKKASDVAYMSLTEESCLQEDEKVAGRKLTDTIFIKGNDYFLAVIFWYILLGPIGCLIYRFVYMMARLASQGSEPAMIFADSAIRLNEKLNWLPSRLSGFLFVLFRGKQAKKAWKENVFSNASDEECLTRCGLAGVKMDSPEDLPSLEENKDAIYLIDRAIYIVLGVYAMETLLSWVFSSMGYSILLLSLL